MNVKELIEELSTLHTEALVVKSGYEGGLDNIQGARYIKVKLNVNTVWYYGPHEEDKDGIEVVFVG